MDTNQIPAVHEIFTKYVTTVNDGIFRAYTSNIRRARHAHTVTGLPDAYSRGRIIGVYARLALYGADYLMAEKVRDWNGLTDIDEETIRLREEINLQYQALGEVVKLGDLYGVRRSPSCLDVKKLSNGLTSPSWLSAVSSTVLLLLSDVCLSFLTSTQNVTWLAVLTLNQKSKNLLMISL